MGHGFVTSSTYSALHRSRCCSPSARCFTSREATNRIYLTAFIGFSYLMMCNVKYGMNLRYTNMWDMPMRSSSRSLNSGCSRRIAASVNIGVLLSGVVALCALDLRQYDILFVQFNVDYEMISANLLQALRILKFH
jgi:hypothetical protein